MLTALLATTALLAAACTTSTGQESAERAPGSDPALLSAFDYERLDPAAVTTQPEGITVEQSFVLDFYTLFHSRKYTVTRVLFPGVDGEAVAHLALPPGPGPHPTVVVYPILAGSHIVSEGLSKALVRRGFAVARLERKDLELDNPERTLRDVRQALHSAVIDGRRLLDWLETLPEVDPQRLAAAGVSMGGIQALLLSAADSRVRGGFYLMVGGGLPQILWESTERPVRTFRDNLIQRRGLDSREAFEELAREETWIVDPLSHANRLEPERVMMASGRFDRVIRPETSEALWEALGSPRWIRLPIGHYYFFPFFWWTAARGADHLDRVFAGDV